MVKYWIAAWRQTPSVVDAEWDLWAAVARPDPRAPAVLIIKIWIVARIVALPDPNPSYVVVCLFRIFRVVIHTF